MGRESVFWGQLLVFLWLVACGRSVPTAGAPLQPTVIPSETPSPSPSATLTSIPPTPTQTPVPLAAVVNGEPIELAVYESHLAGFLAAQSDLGTTLVTKEPSEWVLDDLINQALLVQAASQAGFVIDEPLLEARIRELAAEMGGMEALLTWRESYGFTEADFRQELARAIAAAWMRDQIVASVPETAEQIHALQILLYNSEDAERVLKQVQSGSDFENLARDFDPLGLGDLGWFPRGYLTEPSIESAAFALQPGEVSPIIETQFGFHIIQVIERLDERALDPDMLYTLQRKAIQDWLQERRAESEIQLLIP